MGNVKSFVSQTRWVVVPQDVIATVRTNLTPSLVSVVVSPIPRSEFSIWAAKRLELMNSLCVSILCLMNLSSSLLWLVYALDSPSCPSEHTTDIRDPLLKLSGGPNSSFPDVKRSSFPRNGDSPSLNATNSRI